MGAEDDSGNFSQNQELDEESSEPSTTEDENSEGKDDSHESSDSCENDAWGALNTDEAQTGEPARDFKDYMNDENDTGESLWMTEPLYENSTITVLEAIYGLLYGYIRFRKSKACLAYDLQQERRLLPEDNEMPENVDQLFAYVKSITATPKVTKFFYCSKCLIFGSKEEKFSSCNQAEDISLFFLIDVSDIIRILFEKLDLAKRIVPFSHADVNEDVISDIRDGSEYIRVNSRENRGPYDLTLAFNTDGVSVVESNKSYCWPVFFSICELPPEERESNIIFGGVWYSAHMKPPMNVFLDPLVNDLKNCYHKGVSWRNPETAGEVKSRVVVPLAVGDAPCRADLLNMVGFLGKNGCNSCEITMKTIEKPTKKAKKKPTIYPYNEIPARLRTKELMHAHAERAEALKALPQNQNPKKQKKINAKGIKGHSKLSEIPLFDISRAVPPEIMHSQWIGFGSQHLEIIRKKKGEYNIKSREGDVDAFLMRIQPPSFFARMPRSLKYAGYFKASEMFYWVIYYSLPALEDILPKKYLDHWTIYVASLTYLLGEKIEKSKLEDIELALKIFVKRIPQLYGEEEMKPNVHYITHLVSVVKRWGPLWTTWMFPFEGSNKMVTESIHGTKHQGQELINRILLISRLNQLKWKMNRQSRQGKVNKFILVGKIMAGYQFDEDEQDLILTSGLDSENIQVYERVKIGNRLYTSLLSKVVKSNSYSVSIKTRHDPEEFFGMIRLFLISENNKLFLMIRPFIANKNKKGFFSERFQIKTSHIAIKESNRSTMLLQLDDILKINHVIRVGDYICKQPFTYHTVL